MGHVYGHGTVFTWFTRYIVMGILVVLLYHVLQYAHSGFERTMRVWNGVAERKARDAKEAKLKEKAKERRKRAKDNEKTAAEIAEDKEAEAERLRQEQIKEQKLAKQLEKQREKEEKERKKAALEAQR